jgi:hypothetical protein
MRNLSNSTALVVLINTGFWWALYGFKEDNFAAIEKICN